MKQLKLNTAKAIPVVIVDPTVPQGGVTGRANTDVKVEIIKGDGTVVAFTDPDVGVWEEKGAAGQYRYTITPDVLGLTAITVRSDNPAHRDFYDLYDVVTYTTEELLAANGVAISALPDAAANQAAAEAAIIAQAVSTLTTGDIPTDEDNAVAVLEKLIADHKAVDGSLAFFINRIAAAVRGYYKMDTDGTYAVKDDAGATVDGGTYKNPDGEGSDSAIVERVPDDLPE